MTTKTKDLFTHYPSSSVAGTGATNPQVNPEVLDPCVASSGATPDGYDDDALPQPAFVVSFPREFAKTAAFHKSIYWSSPDARTWNARRSCHAPRYEASEDIIGSAEETAATMIPRARLWQQPERLFSQDTCAVEEQELLMWDLPFDTPPAISTKAIRVTLRHLGKRRAPSIDEFIAD